MSDAELRRLQRDAAADPEARRALGFENVRRGLGWHGEPLPAGPKGSMAADESSDDLGYLWHVAGSPLSVEMVRVPAEDGAGAFWIGRYPVTWGEYGAAASWLRNWPMPMVPRFASSPGKEWEFGIVGTVGQDFLARFSEHPVVNVSPSMAGSFCEWSGLRLPTVKEWTRAAYGGPESLPACGRCKGGGITTFGMEWRVCHDCSGLGKLPERPWPWGVEEPGPDHAVHPRWMPAHGGSTDAVRVRDGAGSRPSRPKGRSPSGAHDMVGNVCEIVHDTASLRDLRSGRPHWSALGGSWRNSAVRGLRVAGADDASDDMGFRVALSAEDVA